MATTSRRVRPTLAQRLKDPALRAKLQTSQLTPKLQQERRINQRIARENASPLYNPAAPMSGHDLVKAAGQMTAAQLDPQVAALDRQSAQTQTQGQALVGNAGSYYRQVAQREAEGVARQRALGAMLQAHLGNVASGAQADFDHQAAAEQQRQQADAAVRGVSTPSDQVAGELTALRGRSDAMSQAAQTEGAQQSDNWANLQNALSGAMTLRGQEEVGRLSNREANQLAQITGKRGDIEATRGPTTAKNITDLRQQGFEDIATAKGLNIKSDAQVAAEAKAKRDAKIAAQRIKSAAHQDAANRKSRDTIAGQNLTARQKALTEQHRHNVAVENRPGKQPKEPQTAVEHRRIVNNLSSEIAPLMHSGHARERAAQIIRTRAARAGQSMPDDLLSAALDLAYDGHVSRRNRGILRQGGMVIPASWMPKRPPRSGGAVGVTTPLG